MNITGFQRGSAINTLDSTDRPIAGQLARRLGWCLLVILALSSLAACGGGYDAAPVAAPAITAQPAGAQVHAGAGATFSVAASGSLLAYQWRRNGIDIAGATADRYSTPAATAADNGSLFTVVVSNSAGSVTSNPATLTVLQLPVITTQPSATSATTGSSATFNVIATGTAPLSYLWTKNGAAIAGATGSSHTTPPTARADNLTLFAVTVSNVAGTVTSATATLTVTPAPQ